MMIVPRSPVVVRVRICDFMGSPFLVRGDVRRGAVGRGSIFAGRKGASGHSF